MRIFGLLALGLGLAIAPAPVFSQEHSQESSGGQEEGEGNLAIWKWANFVVLAAGIGYVTVKQGAPFFAGRLRRIRKNIVEARDISKEAEARVAEVERRLANLGAEISALRVESQKEAESERQSLAQQTAVEVGKIQVHAEQEIAAAAKAARMELKRYAASLAVEMAEKKLRSRITPDAQNELVEGFVRGLQRSSSKAQTT